jgi:hypothetical protein
METASSTASAVHSSMSQPSASAMTVWCRGQQGIGSYCVRPPATDTPAVNRYNDGARRGWASGDARESCRQPSRSCTASQVDTSGGVVTTMTTRSDWTPTWMGVPEDEGAK